MLVDRLKQYKLTNKFSNRELSLELGIDEHKIGKILNGKYQGSFEEFEEIVSKISDTPDDEYYYSTGKHLESQPQPQPTTNCTSEIAMLSNTIKDLTLFIAQLSHNLDELRAEIHELREEKKSQGRAKINLPVKIPDT